MRVPGLAPRHAILGAMTGSNPADPDQRLGMTAPRPRAVAAVEAASVGLAVLLFAVLVARLAGSLAWPSAWGAAVSGSVAGYLAADLASGLVHWFCDRFFEEDTPVIGRLLIFPFRDHHREPEAMCMHGLLELCGNSCLGLIPVLALAVLRPLPVMADSALAAFALALTATNLFHAWAHAPRVPALAVWLQARQLILSPAAHHTHHAPGHVGAYCVTSGWANRWLDGLGLLDRFERALVAAGVPRTHEP